MRLETPEKIRDLQRKLYFKAKREPKYRFYLLQDKVWREDILQHSYRLVRANGGAPGIDGVSFESIESGEGETEFLQKLQQALKEKSYLTHAYSDPNRHPFRVQIGTRSDRNRHLFRRKSAHPV